MSEVDFDLNPFITQIGNSLIIAIPNNLSDAKNKGVAETVVTNAFASQSNGVIFDFSQVRMVDSVFYKIYTDAAKALDLLGIPVVWTGLGAAIICAMIDLGIEIDASLIQTTQTIETGLDLLANPQMPVSPL